MQSSNCNRQLFIANFLSSRHNFFRSYSKKKFMEKMSDLRDLLRHEIYDLYSAEEQIIKALPAMIEKANNAQLKTALQQHLDVTRKQLTRLDKVQSFFSEGTETAANEKKGLLARLFKRNHMCRGMKGLIEEGENVMSEEMSSEVLDAAIVACAQKIEHYEICGYGTARAFARELNLAEVTRLLEQTLNEEYEADDRLTELAVGRLNQQAETATGKRAGTATGSSATVEKPMRRMQTRELEMEMASNQAATATTKKRETAPRSRSPRGEAERSESPRQTSSTRRTTTNSSNARSAKGSSGRKTTNSRGSKAKRRR